MVLIAAGCLYRAGVRPSLQAEIVDTLVLEIPSGYNPPRLDISFCFVSDGLWGVSKKIGQDSTLLIKWDTKGRVARSFVGPPGATGIFVHGGEIILYPWIKADIWQYDTSGRFVGHFVPDLWCPKMLYWGVFPLRGGDKFLALGPNVALVITERETTYAQFLAFVVDTQGKIIRWCLPPDSSVSSGITENLGFGTLLSDSTVVTGDFYTFRLHFFEGAFAERQLKLDTTGFILMPPFPSKLSSEEAYRWKEEVVDTLHPHILLKICPWSDFILAFYARQLPKGQRQDFGVMLIEPESGTVIHSCFLPDSAGTGGVIRGDTLVCFARHQWNSNTYKLYKIVLTTH
ncbi:MAG: hypothetical protein ABIN58_05675 [candidate division WOR-3 bacterium]